MEVGGEFLAAEAVARELGRFLQDATQCVWILAGTTIGWITLVMKKADGPTGRRGRKGLAAPMVFLQLAVRCRYQMRLH